MSETVGLVGLGNMGLAMAQRLIEQGWKLRVWNRSPEKAEPLVRRGATRAERPEDAVEPGGIVISMLSDDMALGEVFGAESKLVERLGAGGVHLSMSTIHPDTSRRLAKEHQRVGASYLGAPVFGRPDAAAAGTLWIAVSGAEQARRRVAPLLAAIGRGTFEFGNDPGAANVAKLCANFLIASTLEGLAEVAAVAEKSGLGAGPVVEMLSQTLFACPVYQGYGKAILARKFQPAGFRLRLGLKDVELALAAARSVEAPMPFASLLRDRALAAINKGRGDWDWSSLSLEAAEDAGVGGKTAAGD
jgi:3-hydroxyisobutyrate dehydrogenase-like beta-hydroxyacid dehydrogenase